MSEKKNVENILSELGKKIDQLIDEAKEVGGKVAEEMESKVNDLKAQKEKIENDIKNNTANNEKWEEAKSHLNTAADSLKKAFESFFKKDEKEAKMTVVPNEEE